MRSENKELKAAIRAHLAHMRKQRIRKVSFMNAGLTPDEYRANKELFAMKTELIRRSNEIQ